MVFEYFGTSGIRAYIQQAIDQAGKKIESLIYLGGWFFGGCVLH